MAGAKDRTISYRRATWFNTDPTSISLEWCIRQATTKLKDVSQRTIARDNGQEISMAKLKAPKGGGFFVHITVDTPGEAASIVPTVKKTVEEIDVATAKAPPESEFMDGDAFLYVRDDHVCMCSTGMRDGSIVYFFAELFKRAKFRGDADKFDLMKVADVNKTKLIKAQGVKEIELRAVMSEETAHYNKRKGQAASIAGAAARHARLLFGNINDVTNDALRVGLTIKVDHRFRKHLSLGEKRLEQLALSLVKDQEAGDDFVIVTEGGQKISPQEIYMKTTVPIESIGKSVKYEKAWKELGDFFATLVEGGAIEQ